MTEPLDLNKPLTIKRFIDMLYEAAGVCQMDAEMLRERGEDGTVWQIAHEELGDAADRIKKRTAGLSSPLRYDPEPEDEPGASSGGRNIAPPRP